MDNVGRQGFDTGCLVKELIHRVRHVAEGVLHQILLAVVIVERCQSYDYTSKNEINSRSNAVPARRAFLALGTAVQHASRPWCAPFC